MNCGYCEFRCDLSKGDGVCKRYMSSGDAVLEKEPMRFLPLMFYRVEEMPFFHAMPGKNVAQFGTKSCNAACDYCLNSHVAIDDMGAELHHYTAEQLITNAIANGAEGVVFGMNEVTCFIESALSVAKAAHEAGLKVGCLTNGFQTEETAKRLADNMDFINLSLKSFDDDFYRKNLHLPSVAPILRNLKIFAQKTHLEVTTPLVSELNKEKLLEMARFLSSVDRNIPWHLFRLQPANLRMEVEPLDVAATVATINEASSLLPYIYLGNLAGSRWVNTVCPDCGRVLIKRICIGACGSKFGSMEFDGEHCPQCGAKIAILL